MLRVHMHDGEICAEAQAQFQGMRERRHAWWRKISRMENVFHAEGDRL